MTIQYYGVDLHFALQETYKVERQVTEERDIVTRKYTTRAPSSQHDAVIPALDSSEPDYPLHKLKEKQIVPRYPDFFDVTLTYTKEAVDSDDLPSTKQGYVGGTIERFIGSHPDGDPNQGGEFDTVWNWLGQPTSDGQPYSAGNNSKDLRGIPSNINATGTNPTYKPGVESYLIPTLFYWRETYHISKPDRANANIGKLEIPPGESGPAKKWLKMSWTADRDRIGGYWRLRQEWQYLTIGDWDTDLYETAS